MGKTKNKDKITYGKKSVLDSDEFDPKHSKVLISIRLDGDVLQAIRQAATLKGAAYQTMINEVLRHTFVEAREPDLTDDEKRQLRMILARNSIQAAFCAPGGALFIEGPKLKTG